MERTLLAAGVVLALSSSFTINAAEDDKPQYLSDWRHQGVNVVESYHIRFGPQLRNDTYLECKAFTKKGRLDSYGYASAPVFFGGDSDVKGTWNHSSPLFMEIEPRFSIDKLTNTDLSFDPLKEWYFANNYIYDMGRNRNGRQSTWCMGLGIDIGTGLPTSLFTNVYVEYQRQNYDTANESEWDGYRLKVKYFVPITDLRGGQLSYTGFTNFDWGSDLGDDSGYANDGIKTRTNNLIASSHILVLNHDHWYYFIVARYWRNSGWWDDDVELNFDNGNLNVHFTSWGGYLVVGYNP